MAGQIEVDGLSVHYVEQGTGPPVLFLHGFGDAVFVWEDMLSRLTGHRLIAVDLKGHGDSGKPRDGRYSLRDHAAVVSGLMAALDLRDVVLVGQSLGAAIALVGMVWDDNLRSRTRALALLDAPAYPQKMPWFLAILRIPIVRYLSDRLMRPEAKTRATLKLVFHRPERIAEDHVAVRVRFAGLPGAGDAMAATAQMMIPDDVAGLTSAYADVRVPTLLIWGEQDRVVPLAVGQSLVRQMPNARLEVVPDCGHNPHEEQPVRTAELLSRFLEEVAPATSPT